MDLGCVAILLIGPHVTCSNGVFGAHASGDALLQPTVDTGDRVLLSAVVGAL